MKILETPEKDPVLQGLRYRVICMDLKYILTYLSFARVSMRIDVGTGTLFHVLVNALG